MSIFVLIYSEHLELFKHREILRYMCGLRTICVTGQSNMTFCAYLKSKSIDSAETYLKYLLAARKRTQ